MELAHFGSGNFLENRNNIFTEVVISTNKLHTEYMNTKYPEITIQLTGEDGNAFAIMGRCYRAMRRNGLHEHIEAFTNEATSADYHHLLRTVMQWFSWE